MKKLLGIVIAIIVIFFVVATFYANNVHQLVGLYGSTYYAKGTDLGDVTISFGDVAEQRYENVQGTDASMYVQYKYSYESRPTFLFGMYFYGHSAFTMKKATHEGTPVQMDLD